jgi:Ca-activated chloride channel homolog
VSVALLLDISNSVSHILETERLAASRFFLDVVRPQDKAMLVTFSHVIDVAQGLTSSVGQLRDALRGVRQFGYNLPSQYDAHGGTLLFEAIKQVCEGQLAPLPGRKMMVIISDGFDNGSRVNENAAIEAAQRANTVIYAIRYAGSSGESPEGELSLNRLSDSTGGRTFNVNHIVPLESVFHTIEREMRNQYAIGYVSTNRARDGRFRRLTITVSGRRRYTIQARAGYYAPR